MKIRWRMISPEEYHSRQPWEGPVFPGHVKHGDSQAYVLEFMAVEGFWQEVDSVEKVGRD
jgi:hypothetical protein